MILQGILPSTSFFGVAMAVGECVEHPVVQFVAIQSNAWIQKCGETAFPCWNSINITRKLDYQSPPSHQKRTEMHTNAPSIPLGLHFLQREFEKALKGGIHKIDIKYLT